MRIVYNRFSSLQRPHRRRRKPPDSILKNSNSGQPSAGEPESFGTFCFLKVQFIVKIVVLNAWYVRTRAIKKNGAEGLRSFILSLVQMYQHLVPIFAHPATRH